MGGSDILMNDEINKNVLKTGTLTIGIVCKDAIVIAADKKQTYAGGGGVAYNAGVAKKIIEINDRLIVTTAGNASDTRKVVDIVRAELRLKELRTRGKVSTNEAASLTANMVFQNIRTPSMIPSISHFLFAGYDEKGMALFDISPDGYMQKSDTFSATGSGIMQAHPILDTEYKKEMNVEEAIKLAIKCVKATTGRDPGVGAGVDVYVVRKDKIEQVLDQEMIYELKNSK